MVERQHLPRVVASRSCAPLRPSYCPYSVVLPICKACIDGGCHIIVRAAGANAKAVQARLDRENNRETASATTTTKASAPKASAVAAAAASTTATPPEVLVQAAPTTPMPRTRRNKRTVVSNTGGKRSRRSA